MHVLVIPSWYPTTEAPLNGIYFVEQAQCLANHGMQVGVVYPEQQSLRRLSWDALRTKHFQTEWTRDHGIPTLRRYGWNVWWRFPPGLRCRVRSAVRLARRYVERFGNPDIIHAQSGRWAGAAAARISARMSVPYVLTEHFSGFRREAIFPWRWPLIEEGYQHAAGLAAVSSDLKRSIVDCGLSSPANVDVHPNLVDGSFFTRPPSSRSSPPPFRFVTVARLKSQKNISGLLRAFAKMTSHSNRATLTIVGDGPERSPLEQTSRELGIANQVFFKGHLDRESVRRALWTAHAFALPSRNETFGVVLLEAMATGLPVIATACGGPEDIVTSDTGTLVPVDDPEALTNALRDMREHWSSFNASAIRETVLERYGPEPFVRRTRILYRRALAQST